MCYPHSWSIKTEKQKRLRVSASERPNSESVLPGVPSHPNFVGNKGWNSCAITPFPRIIVSEQFCQLTIFYFKKRMIKFSARTHAPAHAHTRGPTSPKYAQSPLLALQTLLPLTYDCLLWVRLLCMFAPSSVFKGHISRINTKDRTSLSQELIGQNLLQEGKWDGEILNV